MSRSKYTHKRIKKRKTLRGGNRIRKNEYLQQNLVKSCLRGGYSKF